MTILSYQITRVDAEEIAAGDPIVLDCSSNDPGGDLLFNRQIQSINLNDINNTKITAPEQLLLYDITEDDLSWPVYGFQNGQTIKIEELQQLTINYRQPDGEVLTDTLDEDKLSDILVNFDDGLTLKELINELFH